jgi:hypothetical protein
MNAIAKGVFPAPGGPSTRIVPGKGYPPLRLSLILGTPDDTKSFFLLSFSEPTSAVFVGLGVMFVGLEAAVFVFFFLGAAFFTGTGISLLNITPSFF